MSRCEYHTLGDSDLWINFREGDRKALEEIYHRNVDVLYSYGNKITCNSSLVEDCIQEVFITLWEKREKLSDTNSIKFYLFKSLKRRIFKSLRDSQKFGFRYDFADPFITTSLRTDPGNEELDESTIKKINESLNQLTNRQKEFIYLKFYAHLDFQEIAEILNLSVKATYKLQARSLQRLKENFSLLFIFF